LYYTDSSHVEHQIVLRSYIGFHRDVGMALWPAGYVFAEWLIENPTLFQGRRVLSLGSGCGLTEIVMAQVTEYHSIVATDYTADIVSNLHINLMRNGR